VPPSEGAPEFQLQGQSYNEVRREWNGEGALGGLSLHFCPGAPKFQV